MRNALEVSRWVDGRPLYIFHVTDLIGCPFRNLQVRTKEEKERMNKGKKIHVKIQKELVRQGYEIEVEVDYMICNDDRCIKIIGTIDALHRQKHEVIEIKPHKIIGLYHLSLIHI